MSRRQQTTKTMTTNQQSTDWGIRTKKVVGKMPAHVSGCHDGNGCGGGAVAAEEEPWGHSYVNGMIIWRPRITHH